MENLDDMKTMWLELNSKISALEEENRKLARKVVSLNYKTAREKLIRKYTAFIFVASLMILYTLAFITFNPMIVEKYKIATTIYWIIFFTFEAGIDLYLRQRVKNIDIYNSSISEIAHQAATNWKIHKLAIIIGLPLAIGAVILFALSLNADLFMIYGMIVGGLVGLIIGIFQLIKFYEYYRLLQSKE